jgi:hypothetical protein
VAPVFFAQLPEQTMAVPELPRMELPELRGWLDPAVAVVVDLPGTDSIAYGMSLARQGFRPVPIFNASPGPSPWGLQTNTVVDMDSLVQAFHAASREMERLQLSSEAPPAFLLDAMRIQGHRPAAEEMFDNRWVVFPQDFPSARFLRGRGIGRALLVHDGLQPQEDLAHVLLRWQEGGIDIWACRPLEPRPPWNLTVARPSRYRSLWYRALAMLGLRRNSAGGFGSYIPSASSGYG